jgi:predicted branched-subunit amino acid permease
MRNSFYAIRLASLLRLRGLRRLGWAQVVTDESTAMATGQADRRHARLAFFVTGSTLFLVWNAATVIGALGAGAVGDPNAFGIDAAVPAAFLALVAPRLREHRSRRTAVIAVVIALVGVPFLPVGVPVLLAALAVLPELRRRPGEPEEAPP